MYKYFKNNFFLISIGAVPGALIRWQIDQIFIVNIIGCFLLGFFNTLVISRKYKLIFCFGFCGSMTTFSGWYFHLYNLINQNLYKLFLMHSILIIFIGVLAMGLGNIFANKLNS